MYIDKELEFSLDQAITATAMSANYVNLSKPGDAYDNELYFVAKVGTAFAGGQYLTVELQTADTSDFATPITLGPSVPLTVSDLTANKVIFAYRIPKGVRKYLRVRYGVQSGPFTAGTITTFLTDEVQQSIAQ